MIRKMRLILSLMLILVSISVSVSYAKEGEDILEYIYQRNGMDLKERSYLIDMEVISYSNDSESSSKVRVYLYDDHRQMVTFFGAG